ncbi:MAG: rRNA pseudouridine synthase [Anaerolineae bacterium]|nr:rRNA pseudouridine synthase [Anaerolineae bacterium]
MSEHQRDCLSRVAGQQQLNRVLAAAGFGPAESTTGIIQGGRVAVNGRPARDPRARADPFRDAVTVDGEPLPLDNACHYILLHKPYNVLCAFTDDEGRPTLADYIDLPGVYAAGRLDLDSEGLVLLTDDGWLIHRLSHPRYHQPKTYLVQVEGLPDADSLVDLRRGVMVKGKRTARAQIERLPDPPDLPERSTPIRKRQNIPTSWLRIVLTEGRKRQVRHMTAAVGYPTLRLIRVGMGPLSLGDLVPGEWRELALGEIDALWQDLNK